MSKTKFKLKIDYTKFDKNLKHTLITRMNTVMAAIVAYIKESFGPSNEGGKNPSKEGSTPNIGLSILRNHITFKVSSEGRDVVGTYGVSTGAATAYARRLELGFYGVDKRGRNVRQAPRPYLVPAYENNKRKIKEILKGK